MSTQTLTRQPVFGSLRALACAVLGLAGCVFLLAVASAGDGPPKKRQAELSNKDTGGRAVHDDKADHKAAAPATPQKLEEAPTGFTNTSNGFEDQDAFDTDRGKFEEVEQPKDGLGPVYNATSCVSCHQNPVSGSSSQVSEIRAGHITKDPKNPKKQIFVEPPGGSLVHQRAIDAAAQEHVRPEDESRTLRMSNTILGGGFVEVIPDEDILKVRSKQPAGLKGLAIAVPVAVRGKKGDDGQFTFEFVERIGRFGWKCQEASLLNFSAGAYLNEMGITNPLQPRENKSNGRDVSQFDLKPDPEDKVDPENPANKDRPDQPFGDDVKAFTRFMRSLRAPPRDFSLAQTQLVKDGEKIFNDEGTADKHKLGCAICHHPCFVTPPPGTPIKPLGPPGELPGSDLGTVPFALGNKIIRPYSDFMLHDVGTKDGIVQTQHAQFPPRGVENLRRIPQGLLMKEDKEDEGGVLRIQRERVPKAKGVEKKGAPTEKEECEPTEEEIHLDQRTLNKVRTAPLWGLRVRPQLLHDGSALTIEEAIRRHIVNAGAVVLPGNFDMLPPDQKEKLLAFLKSL
jgi:CxxC motif-containing protein (DUF1111 family)